MSIIYRPHRELLKDAMLEAVTFADEDEMKAWISADSASVFGTPMFSPSEIVIGQEAIDDPRNGWKDTRCVCVNRYGSEFYKFPQCIGFCASDFPKTEKEP